MYRCNCMLNVNLLHACKVKRAIQTEVCTITSTTAVPRGVFGYLLPLDRVAFRPCTSRKQQVVATRACTISGNQSTYR